MKIVKAVGLLVGIYIFLEFVVPIFTAPIPSSVIYMYMAVAIAGILIYTSVENEDWEEFIAPVKLVLEGEKGPVPRLALLAVLPLFAGYLVYGAVAPATAPPTQLRSVHPSPPIEFVGLENPLPKTPENIAEGRELYEANCEPCHGEEADGKGPEARGFFPEPMNFKVESLGIIPEGYAFWRITKGGEGLPPEGAPWDSAMPAWEDILTEEEIWKIIMAEYDIAGVEPRTWE
jgi:mono/diheme cytochrome c family protein